MSVASKINLESLVASSLTRYNTLAYQSLGFIRKKNKCTRKLSRYLHNAVQGKSGLNWCINRFPCSYHTWLYKPGSFCSTQVEIIGQRDKTPVPQNSYMPTHVTVLVYNC